MTSRAFMAMDRFNEMKLVFQEANLPLSSSEWKSTLKAIQPLGSVLPDSVCEEWMQEALMAGRGSLQSLGAGQYVFSMPAYDEAMQKVIDRLIMLFVSTKSAMNEEYMKTLIARLWTVSPEIQKTRLPMFLAQIQLDPRLCKVGNSYFLSKFTLLNEYVFDALRTQKIEPTDISTTKSKVCELYGIDADQALIVLDGDQRLMLHQEAIHLSPQAAAWVLPVYEEMESEMDLSAILAGAGALNGASSADPFADMGFGALKGASSADPFADMGIGALNGANSADPFADMGFGALKGASSADPFADMGIGALNGVSSADPFADMGIGALNGASSADPFADLGIGALKGASSADPFADMGIGVLDGASSADPFADMGIGALDGASSADPFADLGIGALKGASSADPFADMGIGALNGASSADPFADLGIGALNGANSVDPFADLGIGALNGANSVDPFADLGIGALNGASSADPFADMGIGALDGASSADPFADLGIGALNGASSADPFADMVKTDGVSFMGLLENDIQTADEQVDIILDDVAMFEGTIKLLHSEREALGLEGVMERITLIVHEQVGQVYEWEYDGATETVNGFLIFMMEYGFMSGPVKLTLTPQPTKYHYAAKAMSVSVQDVIDRQMKINEQNLPEEHMPEEVHYHFKEQEEISNEMKDAMVDLIMEQGFETIHVEDIDVIDIPESVEDPEANIDREMVEVNEPIEENTTSEDNGVSIWERLEQKRKNTEFESEEDQEHDEMVYSNQAYTSAEETPIEFMEKAETNDYDWVSTNDDHEIDIIDDNLSDANEDDKAKNAFDLWRARKQQGSFEETFDTEDSLQPSYHEIEEEATAPLTETIAPYVHHAEPVNHRMELNPLDIDAFRTHHFSLIKQRAEELFLQINGMNEELYMDMIPALSRQKDFSKLMEAMKTLQQMQEDLNLISQLHERWKS